jgi:hypothetical protein
MRPLTRQSRHAALLGQMVGLLIVSAWQILSGVERHETMWHTPTGSYLPLALSTLLGCMMMIAAALQADAWTAAAFEACGSIVLSVVLGIDLWSVVTTTPFPDTDIVAGLLGGLMVGLLFRIGILAKDIVLVVKDQRAPPVGDLDLLAVQKVDSATALVVGSETAHAVEARSVEARAPVEVEDKS